MIYMYSQSTGDGRMTLRVSFRLGTNLDMAQVLVQNRVAVAQPRLPEEVRRVGVTTRKSSPDLLMVVNLYSPDGSRDALYISNYVYLRLRDVLARLDGVGDIQIFGGEEYSMRVWLDPDRMAELDLTEEVRRVGVTTRKSSPDLLMVVNLYSPDGSRDALYISNYVYLRLRDVLARLDGVGDIQIFGGEEYSMRVWLDPDRMAELDLTA